MTAEGRMGVEGNGFHLVAVRGNGGLMFLLCRVEMVKSVIFLFGEDDPNTGGLLTRFDRSR